MALRLLGSPVVPAWKAYPACIPSHTAYSDVTLDLEIRHGEDSLAMEIGKCYQLELD